MTRNSTPEEARNYMKDKMELLEKASKHIYYEVKMFYETYIFFKTKKTYNSLLIEIFLLHCRNLFEFFYPTKKIRTDDICVFDFLDYFDEFNNNKVIQEDLGFDKENINKFLSHLTYTRCYIDEMMWPLLDIGEKMVKTIKAFYKALPDNCKNWVYFKELNDLLN